MANISIASQNKPAPIVLHHDNPKCDETVRARYITKEYKYISLGKTGGIISTAPGKKNGKTIVEKREIVW